MTALALLALIAIYLAYRAGKRAGYRRAERDLAVVIEVFGPQMNAELEERLKAQLAAEEAATWN